MNVAMVIAILASLLSVYVGALSLRFSVAPGWKDQRWFAIAALSASAYSALNLPVLTPWASPGVTIAVMRLQVLFAGMHVLGWTRYADVYLGERPGRFGRAVTVFAVCAGLLAQVPGAVYGTTLNERTYVPLSVVYREPVTSWFGDLTFVVYALGLATVLVRFARARRRSVPHAITHAVALGVLLCLMVNDALVVARIVDAPYLFDLAYVFPICVVGYALTSRFAADARALATMRARLEALVAERTEELGRAQEALHRSEKLAALGQLAAGVAHEVSNPAAVVSANLGYLEHRFASGEDDEVLESVREAKLALQRVSSITRQLLHAGQLAGSRMTSQPISVSAVVREALATVRGRCPAHVTLRDAVPEELWAAGDQAAVHQVLVSLALNGIQAIPPGRPGQVIVEARSEGGRVRIEVTDDGEGMPPEVLRRLFEPFFTTKPFGAGTGLGLALSRGLVAGLGGELRLESEAGRGTRAVVELPDARSQRATPAKASAPA